MPTMTQAEQVAYAKRLARVTGSALKITYDDDVPRHYIHMGTEEFCKHAHGMSKEDYLTITPQFTVRDDWYINLTIEDGADALVATDIAITATDTTDTTGAATATLLETAINAAIGGGGVTVAWSDTTWRFTITPTVGSSSITVDSPSIDYYIDATAKLFGATGTQTGTHWDSSFPEDCTLKSSLPSDFFELEYIDYDGHILQPAPFSMFMSPRSVSSYPEYYAIKDREIFISPTVDSRKMIKIRYKHVPSVASISGSDDATTSCLLPPEVHMAPVYYAAGMMLKETFEEEEAAKKLAMFFDIVRTYNMRQANQNPKMFPQNVDYYVPRVQIDE